MNPKFLLFLTWLFFIIERRTSDPIWLICMVYSAVLFICAFFYQRENNTAAVKEKKQSQ
jgi:hypothetical protein